MGSLLDLEIADADVEDIIRTLFSGQHPAAVEVAP
jgi:hypothetical protein